jgi:tetratricopeptide (TPR) repeat protein
MWPEVIESNLASEAVAKAYGAQNQPGQTTWLHAQDFMVHAYLQLAQDRAARAIVDERNTIAALDPVRLPNDTAFAAIPVRYVLERGAWEEAAALDTRGLTFPQAKAIIHFGRALGAARRGDPAAAQPDLQALGVLNNGLVETHDPYWADQVEIQGLAAAAWIAHAQGQDAEAVELMGSAADREDASEKHIAMENRLWPMRELLGELLLEAGQPAAALTEFEASLQVVPNRFRAFAGAARAAEQLGDQERALGFYARLVALGENADTDRPELIHARIVLAGAEAYGL